VDNLTSSFASNDSSFYLSDGTKFINNKDFILYNQVPGGIKNRVTDKIQIVSNTIPSGSTLSPFRSVSQTPFASGSDPNINYLEVAFSPTDQVNSDIFNHIGGQQLDNFIGNPREAFNDRYEELRILNNDYWKKYT